MSNFLIEVEPILNEMASLKLAFLFKKRISDLLDLTLNEIDKSIKVKNKENFESLHLSNSREATSVVKRFVILLILESLINRKIG